MKKVIGIDLGGTSINGGLIDEEGNILKRTEKDSRTANGRHEVLQRISEVIDTLMEEDVIGIGIGSPGFINSAEGRVLKVGGNIKGWAWTNIKDELKKDFPHMPIYVENDANVAAICEDWKGAAKNYNNFVMITLGSGLGGAIKIDNYGMLTGYSYRGAELGHAIFYPNGRLCTCGQKGCVEQYISGHAVENIYEERSGTRKKGKDIFKSISEDKIANEVVHEFSHNLAIYITTLKNIFDPQAIVIGGGVINSKEYWWDLMIESFKNYSNDSEGMDIVPAEFLNDAGMIGAGKIVFDRLR
ncbi:MAG: ROK family protein [Tissierellaceae bacterium]|nr:ROK family protein [Tissierellaceae bacterium]